MKTDATVGGCGGFTEESRGSTLGNPIFRLPRLIVHQRIVFSGGARG